MKNLYIYNKLLLISFCIWSHSINYFIVCVLKIEQKFMHKKMRIYYLLFEHNKSSYSVVGLIVYSDSEDPSI